MYVHAPYVRVCVYAVTSGVSCKVPRDRRVLVISARATVINLIFAGDCYVSVTKEQQRRNEREGGGQGGIGRRRNNRGVIFYYLLLMPTRLISPHIP